MINTGFNENKRTHVGDAGYGDEKFYVFNLTQEEVNLGVHPCMRCDLDNNPNLCKDFQLGIDYSCMDGNYYYKSEFNTTEDELSEKSRYLIIDVVQIAKSCIDTCVFYEENCYNTNEDTCLIRLIEKTSQKP